MAIEDVWCAGCEYQGLRVVSKRGAGRFLLFLTIEGSPTGGSRRADVVVKAVSHATNNHDSESEGTRVPDLHFRALKRDVRVGDVVDIHVAMAEPLDPGAGLF
jgi:hypothetical protein